MEKEYYMKLAIEEAIKAAQEDEVPVGAVIVRNGEVIARSGNRKERDNCAVSHAEILCIVEAAKACGNWYLDECDLYVTLEPCIMCAGAIVNSRLKSVTFGAYDVKSGALGSVYDVIGDKKLNHTLPVTGGVLQEECSRLLSEFFKKKRSPRT